MLNLIRCFITCIRCCFCRCCRYSLLGDQVERFQVNSETGLISTTVPLDREDVSVYRLTLVAQDSSIVEPRASTVNVLINVLDENDNSPVFAETQYTVYVPDQTSAGKMYKQFLFIYLLLFLNISYPCFFYFLIFR